jgi:hypothetical protein
VLSRRVVNDDGALLDLIRAVKALADGGVVRGAIDPNYAAASLLITLLQDDHQELRYIPERVVHHASGAYRGDGKTDAKHARSSPTKRGCAETCTHCVTVTIMPWISASFALAAMISQPIGTGRSTDCALSCWSISQPWKPLSTSHTVRPH